MKSSYRVQVTPVPSDLDINSILTHTLFRDHVVDYEHSRNRLIIELDHVTTYETCLEHGILCIHERTMKITDYSASSNTEESEIDVETWYETEMLRIQPNIQPIIDDHLHPIFHYQWNARNWLEQFHQVDSARNNAKNYDRKQHLLRVTVMLNTIGVIRKQKYRVNNQEIILKSEPLKTIVYDHNSKLSLEKNVKLTELKTPYDSTKVIVVNEDCLVFYEQLVSEGHRPVLLNMANANTPGGGYRKGDGAQEENLFRRSNYYQSLDVEIADPNLSEWLLCTPRCDHKRIVDYPRLYPMDEFGAIYTSGITVFRQTEINGYEFMKRPLYNVCAIAMAAHRNPEMKDAHTLTDKFVMSTHKKIDNIFAIAHAHQHDCLVLSALGCGAFKNPPKHVASIFKSIILQYAGYFQTIYFAIVDDHNTRKKTNPHGNLSPYQEILDGFIVYPPNSLHTDVASGPYRILSQPSREQIRFSDVSIGMLRPCNHGVKCHDMRDPDHTRKYFHPSVCPDQAAQSSCKQKNDDVHILTFIHVSMCTDGGKCENTEERHISEYSHPEFCEHKGRCQNITEEHIFAYRHVPLCRDGLDCPKLINEGSRSLQKLSTL